MNAIDRYSVAARHYAGYLLVRISICVLQTLHIESCHTLARALAVLANDVLRVRRKVVDENLRHAYPRRSAAWRRRLGRAMWEHLFLFVAEVAQAPRKIHETNWRQHIRLRDAGPLVQALLDERPLLLVSAHFGHFEMAGYLLGMMGFPTHTVARTLDNPYLDRFLNRFRSGTGQRMIPKRGGYAQIAEVLASGGTMAFLADQYAGSKGCWVDFFGRPASTHKAIALFALHHDAPLAVGCCTRREGRPLQFEMDFLALADPRSGEPHVGGVRELTAWYTSQLEAAIRRMPEQYWWVHRRWKDHRRQRHSKRAA